MKPTHSTRRLVLAGLTATLLSGGCAMLEPRVEQYVAPPVGATWTVAQRNTGSFGKDVQVQFTRGEGSWQGGPAMTFSISPGPIVMATPDTGRWIAIVGRDGKPIVTWDPPIGWHYPLHVGRTWTASHRVTLHAANRTVSFDYSCKVDKYGDVTVPAGTFKGFRIPCTSTVGHEDVHWYSPDLGIFVKTDLKRPPSHPFGQGTQQTELVSQAIRK